MKYLYLKILLILCLLTSYSFSQSHPIWQKVFPSPWGTPGYASGGGIAPADNGNFYFFNHGSYGPHGTQIVKINPYGDTIWTRFVDSIICYTGVSSGDGGYVVTGDNHTVKISSIGDIIWNKINSSVPCNTWNMIRTEYNIYAICGDYYNNGVIITVDSTGNLIWYHLYPSPNYRRFYTICRAYNGGYIAAGYYDTSMYGIGGGVITRVDDAGVVIWEKIFYFSLYHIVEFFSIDRIDGGYLLLPHYYSDTTINRNRAEIMKIDTGGNLKYLKTLPDDTNRTLLLGDLKIINPNKYLICGSIADTAYDTVSARIYITDSLGNILKKGLFHETQISLLSNSYVINENDFIFIGLSDYFQPNQYYNTYVVRADTNFHAPPIGIKTEIGNVPVDFQLWQNYPNPFNCSTRIKFDIPFVSKKHAFDTRLIIHDVLGREVAVLVDKQIKAGTYEVQWNANNFASSVYFYSLIIDNKIILSKKMCLIK
jgi:hypothetical protein